MGDTRLSRPPLRLGAFAFSLLAMLAALTGLPVAAQAQTAAGDIAAQIRQQGYRCDEPTSATKDAKRSKPDMSVWVLKCQNASYRVRLVPDMAARVVKLRRH